MTLDEAIAHAEDIARSCDSPCGREHKELAEWLKELRDIVRCKDCKWQHSAGGGCGRCDRAIANGDEMACVTANDDDYCSYGERREGARNEN